MKVHSKFEPCGWSVVSVCGSGSSAAAARPHTWAAPETMSGLLKAMSPLQFSVYWRLSLVFVFTSFLFFLDIFTAAITAAACRHDNGTESDASRGPLPSNAESNQSQPGERSGSEADWSSESVNRDVSGDYVREL